MAGLGSFYAIAEIGARNERLCDSIRRELQRIDTQGRIYVERRSNLVRLQCGLHTREFELQALLELLRGVQAGTPEPQLWQQITTHPPATRPQPINSTCVITLSAVLAAALSLVLYLLMIG